MLIKGKSAYDLPLLKCEILNNYVCSVTDLEDIDKEIPSFNPRTNALLSHIVITNQDVKDTIDILDTNKVPGPDGISHRMLKMVSNSIAVPLTILFHLSIPTGSYPSIWKLANVMPIFKKVEHSIVENYLPISLLSCVWKMG